MERKCRVAEEFKVIGFDVVFVGSFVLESAFDGVDGVFVQVCNLGYVRMTRLAVIALSEVSAPAIPD